MALGRGSALSRAVKVGVTGAIVALSVFGTIQSTWRSEAVRGFRARLVSAAGPAARRLRLYYTPPVLVRAGERVQVQVDAVCATDDGDPCPTDVELGTQVGPEPWHVTRVPQTSPLFDLSGPAGRAAPLGQVRFFLRATDDGGARESLGATRGDTALQFYVTDRMPTVTMPAIRFGDVRRGEQVLSLPWGSGPTRAGLELGNESDTVGPMSFDVDRVGRIHLLDSLQQRLVTFDQGSPMDEVQLPDTPFDLAVDDDGSAYVLSASNGSLMVRHVLASGSVSGSSWLGEGIPGQIRVMDGRAFANLLPLDAWAEVPQPGEKLEAAPGVHVGRPVTTDREVLRVARPNSVRLGTVVDGRLVDAVELLSDANVGEIALAEPDDAGGYWVVVHVWQDEPKPADQYQVWDVRQGEVLTTFAVSAGGFAAAPPLNRFRLLGDSLYQMTSSSEGLQIIRYRLGGAS
jgi:hypothetical protein